MQELLIVIPKIITIFGVSFIFFWSGIALGVALGLPPIVVILTTSLSYMLASALVTMLGGRVRVWILKRVGKKAELKSDSFLGRIWERYGIIGLGLASPMTVGSQIGSAIGIAMNANPRQLFIWMSIGGAFWSAVITMLVVLGLLGAQVVTQ